MCSFALNLVRLSVAPGTIYVREGARMRRWQGLLTAAGIGLVMLAGCMAGIPADVAPAPGSPSRTELEQLLGRVRVVAQRPQPPGYDRGCRAGQGCVFGPAWSDATTAADGHDGCDTRNNVLAQQLSSVTRRPGSSCVVIAGTLADPYTSKRIDFRKADGGAIQIDHVYPLAAAWDFGASAWPLERRMRFANDTQLNLLAVSGPVNQEKRDLTPAQWLPPARAYHCFYAGKYLTVAVEYQLPVAQADFDALHRVSRTCR